MASSSADCTVVNGVNMPSLLQAMLHSENTSRRRAEAEWELLCPIPGVAAALLTIGTGGGSNPNTAESTAPAADVAALCFVLLKNSLTKFCDDDVAVVQSSILRVLAGSRTPAISKLVAGVAVAVAVLNSGRWPELYGALEAMLAASASASGGDAAQTTEANALLCVSELCSVLPPEALTAYANLAVPLATIGLNAASARSRALLTAAAAATAASASSDAASSSYSPSALLAASASNACAEHSPQCQQMALRAIADMLLVVGLRDEAQRGTALAAVCVGAFDSFVAIGCAPMENDAAANGVAHEALKIASLVADFLPTVPPPTAMGTVLSALSSSASIYNYATIEPKVDVCGDVEASVARCSATRWDFVASCLRSKTRASAAGEAVFAISSCGEGPAAAAASEAAFAEFASIALQYCGLGHQQRSDWALDPNAFLKGEEDRGDCVSLAVRDAAAEACDQLVRRFGVPAWGAIFGACTAVLAANAIPPSDAPLWVASEASLFLLSAVLQRRAAVVKTAPPAAHEALVALASSVTTVYLTPGALPPGATSAFLVARALLFFRPLIASCATFVPAEQMAQQLLAPAVATLNTDGGADPLVVCAAALLLSRIVPRCPKADAAAGAAEGLAAAVRLANGCDHELLYQLLELALLWLRRCGPAFAPTLAGLEGSPAALMAVWKAQMEDPNVAELIVDLFGFLLKRCPQTHVGFAPLLPWFASTLGGFESLAAMCAIPSVLAIVRDLVSYGSDAAITEVGNTLLGPLCRLLLNSDDSGVANAASSTLAALLRRLGSAVFSCTVPMPPSHLSAGAVEADALPPLDEEDVAVPVATAMVAVAAKMLSPAVKEFTLLNAGAFFKELVPVVAAGEGGIGGLMGGGGGGGGGSLARFLTALADRAATVRMDATLQEVMLPIACILAGPPSAQTAAALDSLAASQRLVPLFERWLPRQRHFYGRAVLRHTTLALAAVLEVLAGGELGGLIVKVGSGGAAKKQKGSGKASSSSASASPSAVPLRLAVFVALGRQLDVALKAKGAAAEEYASDSGEDDLESLTDGEDADDYGDDGDDEDEDVDPNDCGRDPYADGDEDASSGEDDDDEGADIVGAKVSRSRGGASAAYAEALQRFAAFVPLLGPDAACSGLFSAAEIERLRKRIQ